MFQEVAEEEVDGGGGGEGFGAGEEFGCGSFAVFHLVSFGFGARVIGAERGVIRSEEHVAAAVEMGAELTLRVCSWFARHGFFLLSVGIEGTFDLGTQAGTAQAGVPELLEAGTAQAGMPVLLEAGTAQAGMPVLLEAETAQAGMPVLLDWSELGAGSMGPLW